jgi:hypothetical protein
VRDIQKGLEATGRQEDDWEVAGRQQEDIGDGRIWAGTRTESGIERRLDIYMEVCIIKRSKNRINWSIYIEVWKHLA